MADLNTGDSTFNSQASKHLTTLRKKAVFTVFRKLPIELRLKIFRYVAQNPGPVRLDGSSNSPKYGCKYSGRVKRYVPITLSINRESRAETLKLFHCLELDKWNPNWNPIYPRLPGSPIWLDPKNDLIWLPYFDTYLITEWLKVINNEKIPGVLEPIQEVVVEIRQFRIRGLEMQLEYLLGDPSSECCFTHFPKIKRANFIFYAYHWGLASVQAKAETCKTLVIEWLEKQKKSGIRKTALRLL